MKNLKFLMAINLVWLMCCQETEPDKLIDIKGNEYTLKVYGETVWMIENLKTTVDESGKPIQYYVPNDDSALVDTYGLLYDFETACKVCPKGWRLPNNEEWEKLLGDNGGYVASDYKDDQCWEGDINTNNSLFSVRPAGSGNNGEFPNHFGDRTLFWSRTMEDDHFVWTYIFERGKDSLRTASQHPTYAFSVRCVKSMTD